VRQSLHLGKRQRQIVEAVYRLGEATVAEVCSAIPDPPSYSAVRALLNLLAEKGIIAHRQEGKRYVYRPVAPKDTVRRSVLRELVRNFFAGRPADAVAALLDGSAGRLTPDDLEQLKQLIDRAEGKS
jgi:BlaI family transcriptional regulator, penicillinase repressor